VITAARRLGRVGAAGKVVREGSGPQCNGVVAFGDYLALSRMYKVPTVPGDQEPDRLIEVLSTPAFNLVRSLVDGLL